MKSFRNILFQAHLWTGLVVGVFFILLGLSGSALVYPALLGPYQTPTPKSTQQGSPLPLEQILKIARDDAPQDDNRDAVITLPGEVGDAVTVQFNAQRPNFGQGGRGGAGRRGAGRAGGSRFGGARGARGGFGGGRAGRGSPADARGGRGPGSGQGAASPATFIDPITGAVLGTRVIVPNRLLGIAHQIHESMLLGGAGRTFVGWLGVGMTFLGLSGLYLWWPKRGQWKYAFIVRRNARGVRLYREIHGMLGIWFWAVFIVVSATGVLIVFPSVMRSISGQQGRPEGPPPGLAPPALIAQTLIDVPAGAALMPLNDILKSAEDTSQAKAIGLTVPAQMDRPISVMLAGGAEDGPPRTLQINPYSGVPLVQPVVSRSPRTRGFNVRSVHQGEGLGPVWRFLTFVSGFLPLIFVITGFMMWIKKRKARNTMAVA